MPKLGSLTLLLILMTACTHHGGIDYQSYIAQKGVQNITPEHFDHCHGYGCRLISPSSINDKDSKYLSSLFSNTQNATQEVNAIKHAIAYFEQITGSAIGTDNDIKGTYSKLGDDQHDCVDESVNTTIYLSLLDQMDLLQFHRVSTPTARLPLLSGRLGPHQTAVIKNIATNQRYAVDSWFHNNGAQPEILPLKTWYKGWHPPLRESNAQ